MQPDKSSILLVVEHATEGITLSQLLKAVGSDDTRYAAADAIYHCLIERKIKVSFNPDTTRVYDNLLFWSASKARTAKVGPAAAALVRLLAKATDFRGDYTRRESIQEIKAQLSSKYSLTEIEDAINVLQDEELLKIVVRESNLYIDCLLAEAPFFTVIAHSPGQPGYWLQVRAGSLAIAHKKVLAWSEGIPGFTPLAIHQGLPSFIALPGAEPLVHQSL